VALPGNELPEKEKLAEVVTVSDIEPLGAQPPVPTLPPVV
jgi:hypothetical protein